MLEKVLVVIPVRAGSTRLPGKALLAETGKPLVRHVFEAVASPDRWHTCVATDDDRIAEAVRAFGGDVVMTSTDHASGTDRVAEVAAGRSAPIVVNVQGDEPEMRPDIVEAVVDVLANDLTVPMATAVTRFSDAYDPAAPQHVKAAVARGGRALYFSRSPIPHFRDGGRSALHRHVGIYAYRREFLLRFPDLPRGRLEKAESLEQLRALEHDFPIGTVEVEYDGINVDTREDYERFLSRCRNGNRTMPHLEGDVVVGKGRS